MKLSVVRIENGIQTVQRTETDRLYSFSPSFVLPNEGSQCESHLPLKRTLKEFIVAELKDANLRCEAQEMHARDFERQLEEFKVRLAVVKAHSEKLEKALEETEKRVRAEMRAEIEQELKEQAMMKPASTCSTCSSEEALCDSGKQIGDELKCSQMEEQEAGKDEDKGEVDFFKYYYY